MIKGLGIKGIIKTAYDVAGRPLINQVVKIGTNRTETFDFEKYAYDAVTRGLTTFAPSPWKAFYRGGFRRCGIFISDDILHNLFKRVIQ